MKSNIFTVIDQAIAKAGGSKDPKEVADKNGILVGSPLVGNLVGMAMRMGYMGAIAVNERLNYIWKMFALWHEIAHVLRKHVDEPSFVFHKDTQLFTIPVDSLTIPRHEFEANLISAEYNLDTNVILNLIGYYDKTMIEFRHTKKEIAQKKQKYNNILYSLNPKNISRNSKIQLLEYKRDLKDLTEKYYDLCSDISSLDYCKSISELAGEMDSNEIILGFKFKAMELNGIDDIEFPELPQYNRVFSCAL